MLSFSKFLLQIRLKNAILFILPFFLLFNSAIAQSELIETKSFDKVIINPHIQVIFQEGDTESVLIEDIDVPMNKLTVEVKNKTLEIYLEGARVFTKSKANKNDDWERKSSIYKGTIVKMVVTYKKVNEFSLRGEEKMVFESPIHTEELELKIYGESEILINELVVDDLQVAMYGENELEILKGTTQKQKFSIYGESEINTLGLENQETKVVVFGEADFKLNIVDRLKVTSYGEAKVNYQGNPTVRKGIIIGETTIRKMR
jgi:hypothetical protein